MAAISSYLKEFKTESGVTLEELSKRRPVLLVFLRHFGCTFCRQAVAELSGLRKEIESRGTQLAFVHLSNDPEKARTFFALSKMEDVPRISDPDGRLFQAFGLVRASWRQYLNYESVLKTLIAWLQGHWVGVPAGDVQRMPGVFLLVDGEIRKAYRHKLVSDQPDYLALAEVR